MTLSKVSLVGGCQTLVLQQMQVARKVWAVVVRANSLMLFVSALNLTTQAGGSRTWTVCGGCPWLRAASRRRTRGAGCTRPTQPRSINLSRHSDCRRLGRRLQPGREEGVIVCARHPRARMRGRSPAESEPDKKMPESHSPHPPLAAAVDVERNAERLLSRTHGRAGTEM